MVKITSAQLAQQMRFAGRTLRDLSRAPSRGRGGLRMVRSLSHSTVELRLPWLPYRLIADLEAVVGSGDRVFEFGGGGSTLWFLDRGATVITAEHDLLWGELLRDTVGSEPRHQLRLLSPDDDYAAYVHSIDPEEDDSFTVVVVDGRERVRCFEQAIAKVAPGGWLVIDDIDRERYAAVFGLVDWPHETYIGFAPCKPTFSYTAVFRRPDDVGR